MQQQKDKGKNNGAAPVAPPGEQQIPFPGVFIYRRPGDNPGQERIEIAPVNGLDPLSIPTLLEIALRMRKQELGLVERSQ